MERTGRHESRTGTFTMEAAMIMESEITLEKDLALVVEEALKQEAGRAVSSICETSIFTSVRRS